MNKQNSYSVVCLYNEEKNKNSDVNNLKFYSGLSRRGRHNNSLFSLNITKETNENLSNFAAYTIVGNTINALMLQGVLLQNQTFYMSPIHCIKGSETLY